MAWARFRSKIGDEERRDTEPRQLPPMRRDHLLRPDVTRRIRHAVCRQPGKRHHGELRHHVERDNRVGIRRQRPLRHGFGQMVRAGEQRRRNPSDVPRGERNLRQPRGTPANRPRMDEIDEDDALPLGGERFQRKIQPGARAEDDEGTAARLLRRKGENGVATLLEMGRPRGAAAAVPRGDRHRFLEVAEPPRGPRRWGNQPGERFGEHRAAMLPGRFPPAPGVAVRLLLARKRERHP